MDAERKFEPFQQEFSDPGMLLFCTLNWRLFAFDTCVFGIQFWLESYISITWNSFLIMVHWWNQIVLIWFTPDAHCDFFMSQLPLCKNDAQWLWKPLWWWTLYQKWYSVYPWQESMFFPFSLDIFLLKNLLWW